MGKRMSLEGILKKKAASKSDWGGFWYGKTFYILRDVHGFKAKMVGRNPMAMLVQKRKSSR
jgi:hypothetical protein